MFKREFKVNLKGFIICTFSMVLLFLMVFLLYKSIIKGENLDKINELMTVFPEDVLKMFNIDIAGISTLFGWMKTEGFLFAYLAFGIYSAIIGSNIVLKEESDKTIEYLGVLPVTRNKILTSKICVGAIYIVAMNIIFGIFNLLFLALSEDFSFTMFLLLSISPILPSLVFYCLCLFISTFFKKTKYTLGISFGLVFGTYFLQIVSEISDKVSFFKYFTPFTLADTRNIIQNTKMNIWLVLITILICGLMIFGTYLKYNKKELV